MTSTPRIFRVIMPVSDLDAGVRFYGALFENNGFRVSSGRHYFDCGGVILALYNALDDGDQAPTRNNRDYVYFAVSDLAAIYSLAQKVGGLFTSIGDGGLPMGEIARRPWGEVSFYMHDPSGNPICFVDDKSIFKGPPRS